MASELLRNEMETLRAAPFEALTSRASLTQASPAMESLHQPEATVVVSEVTPGLKEVSVSLKWQSRHGRWIERALVTRIARKEART